MTGHDRAASIIKESYTLEGFVPYGSRDAAEKAKVVRDATGVPEEGLWVAQLTLGSFRDPVERARTLADFRSPEGSDAMPVFTAWRFVYRSEEVLAE